jgi:hypothetical protein
MFFASVLYQWILVRLPRRFSIPMVVLLLAYFAFAFPLLVLHAVPRADRYITQHVPNYSMPGRELIGIPPQYSVDYCRGSPGNSFELRAGLDFL